MSSTKTFNTILQAHYDSHIAAAEKFFTQQRLGTYLNRMVSGAGRYSGTGLVEPFLEKLEQMIRDAASCPLTAEEAEAALVYMLLEEKVSPDHAFYAVLLAAEGYAAPLLSQLPKESLQLLHERYRKKLRRTPGLPCQRSIEKTMKHLLAGP